MEARKLNEVRCIYCRRFFEPIPVIRKEGKKKRAYIECPVCGNGFERDYKNYDRRLKRG